MCEELTLCNRRCSIVNEAYGIYFNFSCNPAQNFPKIVYVGFVADSRNVK